MLNVISLGAGVQSSTMALMAAHGEITPMPDCAIFADTHGEPKEVYEWLDWLEKQLPFPVHRVSAGNLSEKSTEIKTTLDGERTYLKHSVPVFVLRPEGGKGMAVRQCTRDFKIEPIRKEVRKLGASTKTPCTTWIGISLDEVIRKKPSRDAAQINRWPLLEMNITRNGCIEWMKEHRFPAPPKSACIYCPYHSDDFWLSMKADEIDQAAHYENKLQAAYAGATALHGKPFLHASMLPIRDAVKAIKDNPRPQQQDLFGNECEGMCGV